MYTDFIEKINVTNRFFFCILKTDLVWGLQKLDIILENKVCTSNSKRDIHFIDKI